MIIPDHTDTDPTPGNSSVPASSLAQSFAREYVTTYLTAKRGDEETLAAYITIKDLKLPAVAAQFTDANVTFIKQIELAGNGVSVWTVTVSGIVNGNTSTSPRRAYYRVPVTVLDGAPRAAGLPTQVAGPGIGIDLRMNYRHDVATDSPLGTTAAGFVTSYLTGGTDFTRYVTTDSRERPIKPAPYAAVLVNSIQSDVDHNGDGARGRSGVHHGQRPHQELHADPTGLPAAVAVSGRTLASRIDRFDTESSAVSERTFAVHTDVTNNEHTGTAADTRLTPNRP